MKQVKEFITYESGFFSVLHEKHQSLYVDLFGEIHPTNLDMDLLVTCGERYAAPLLIHHDMTKVVDYIVNRYGENWRKINAALTAEYDVLAPYDTKQITTQEKTAENTTTGSVTDKSGVTTFDSETPVDKTIDSTENTGETKATETVKITVENIGSNGNLSVSNLIANEIEVRKNSFIALVMGDVENQLTLDIY